MYVPFRLLVLQLRAKVPLLAFTTLSPWKEASRPILLFSYGMCRSMKEPMTLWGCVGVCVCEEREKIKRERRER
jgi:hypothetical protein